MRFSTAALSVALTAILFSTSATAKPVPINGFAAKVNGKVITKSELSESMKFAKTAIQRMPNSTEKTKMINGLRKDTLEGLIERELILSEFEKRGGQVKQEMVDDDINSIIREDFGNDRSKFLAELKRQGSTIERFRQLREKMIAVRYMRSSQINEIPVATPAEIKAWYDKNDTTFRAEGFIRLRTITMFKAPENGDAEAQRKLVNEIHAKLKKGSDFATLAKAYSIDSAAEKGGDRGTLGRNTDELRKDLVQIAFSLKTGVVSKVLEDQAFFYIMKVESRKPGKRTPLSDEKVRDTVQRRILAEKRQEAQQRWVDRLKKTAVITRY